MQYTHHTVRVRAFTLIEVLIVITIIGILASVVLSSVTAHRERARDAVRLVAVDQIHKAIMAYAIKEGVPPGEDRVMYVNGIPDWIPGLVPEYASLLPSDPRDTTEYSFRYMRSGTDYTLVARLEYEKGEQAKSDGGISDTHYEITSGPFQAITDADKSDWRFASAERVETRMTCPVRGEQVTICHVPPGNTESAQSLAVSCTALGPEGHSNHENDHLGACEGDDTPPPDDDVEGGDDVLPEEEEGDDCSVTITPGLGEYVSGDDVTLAWNSACYASTKVMLEVRKVAEGGSLSEIMIYSSAVNDGNYSYQGFPSALVGSDNWVVRVTDYDTRTTFNESSSFTVTAPTQNVTHTITASAGTGGSITPNGSTQVAQGDSKTFTATPQQGYVLASLIVDGENQATTTTYTFSNVTASHSIAVTFTKVIVPEISELTIHGRFVHAFTKVPLQGVSVRGVVPPTTTRTTLTTSDANGEFTVKTNVSDLVPGGAVRPFSNKLNCFYSSQNDNLATVKRYADGHLGILHNPFDLIRHGSKNIDPVTTNYVDLGDVPLWPAKSITVQSDTPVKFTIRYDEEAHSTGNTLFKTQHTVSDIVALDYDVIVSLTNSAGAVFTSPVRHYPPDASCDIAKLSFMNGEIIWNQ